MIKLEDILAICIAALLAVSILFCAKIMHVPSADGAYYPLEQIVQTNG